MKRSRLLVVAAAAALIFLFAGCGAQEEPEKAEKPAEQDSSKGPVVVASKIDTEGALLGNMMITLLEQNGFTVEDQTQFGPTDVIRKAIKADEIDLYPEYTGNAAFFHGDSSSVWKDPEKAWQRARELDADIGLRWLEPAPANNTWAIAVRRDLSEREGLESLEDLAEYVNEGGTLKLACSEEFASREGALPSFEEAYGFHLEKDQLLILSGGNTATTEKAASQQTDGVNAAMAYGTDGQLATLGLKVLSDTKNVQHVYQPAPLVREEIIREYPQIAEILNPVFATLDLETLQQLNSRIAVNGEPAEDVANEYLRDKGFLD
jgi:osmoprotectant transport system substrate-binding protein